MSKRNVYLVQVDILRKTPRFCTAYLPYAAGQLWAYARQAPAVADAYALREIFFLRHPVHSVAAHMEDPFLVGFSCSCWNTEYNKALARLVRQTYPDCLILFGGHDVPPGGAMLEELPYVDFLIHGEGEIPFQALLAQLTKETPDFSAVPGLSYRTGSALLNNPEVVPASIEPYPSPYLGGVFSRIIAAHPEIQWSLVWETNRGCPNQCAYCDWGRHKAKEPVRQFSMERLTAEIEWISANEIEFIFSADANFGILPRDEEILDMLASARARSGYPHVFFTQTATEINERVFRITEKLNSSGLDKLGPSLSVQSLSPAVLRNIGRKNPDDKTLSEWLRRYRRAGYRTHTDLILGLPGETLQSFCSGVERLFELGQHEGIVYYPCYLLPNTPMAGAAYREKHGIRTTRKIFKQVMEDAPETELIHEYLDMVEETTAMPRADWLTANHFMLLAQGAHGYGLLRLFAMVLHTEKIVSYASFYLRLLDFCRDNPDTLLGCIMARLEKNFSDVAHGEEPEPLQVPGLGYGRMYEDQYFFSRAALEPDRFYAGAAVFLRQFGLASGLYEQLLRYQRESILLPGAAEKVCNFSYDFPAYFNAIYDGDPVSLQMKSVKLRFACACDLSSVEKYYNNVVLLSRFSSNALYKVDYAA